MMRAAEGESVERSSRDLNKQLQHERLHFLDNPSLSLFDTRSVRCQPHVACVRHARLSRGLGVAGLNVCG
eukprot:3489292-Rhodomonas_salina.1